MRYVSHIRGLGPLTASAGPSRRRAIGLGVALGRVSLLATSIVSVVATVATGQKVSQPIALTNIERTWNRLGPLSIRGRSLGGSLGMQPATTPFGVLSPKLARDAPLARNAREGE